MTDNLTLTRRRVLAGLGTIGVASAGAGLGTSAYFSDVETFENNEMVAGEFDLKVDWQVTYTGPDGLEYVDAFPDRYLNEDLDTLARDDLFNLITEPDDVRDPIDTRDALADRRFGDDYDQLTEAEQAIVETAFRGQFADVPQNLVEAGPVIDLDDVKPGDSGWATFSLHLFDNPGYLWMNGSLVEARENETTEPEREDGDEVGSPTEVSTSLDNDVELLDEIHVTVWYDDDGDGVLDGDEQVLLGGNVDPLANPTLRQVLTTLSTGNGIPLDGDTTAEGRDCFPNSTTYYVGFHWELPVDHANQIQSDTVTFDLGFYAEQCRHNDGSGVGNTISVTDVQAVESPNPGPGGLAFGVANNRSEAVRLTSITVSPDAPNLVLLSDDVDAPGGWYGYEVYVNASTPGYTDVGGGVSLPGTITLGSDGYDDGADQEPILAAGETARTTLFAFRDANGDAIDMTGRAVTLVVSYLGETSGDAGTEVVTVVG
jgi:predicted ribosomally synthesized peptide with SipW-like signal peptide